MWRPTDRVSGLSLPAPAPPSSSVSVNPVCSPLCDGKPSQPLPSRIQSLMSPPASLLSRPVGRGGGWPQAAVEPGPALRADQSAGQGSRPRGLPLHPTPTPSAPRLPLLCGSGQVGGNPAAGGLVSRAHRLAGSPGPQVPGSEQLDFWGPSVVEGDVGPCYVPGTSRGAGSAPPGAGGGGPCSGPAGRVWSWA